MVKLYACKGCRTVFYTTGDRTPADEGVTRRCPHCSTMGYVTIDAADVE
jgi:predicted Zn finger-like uncharacterized protein